jgi:hypothetical protein
MAVLEGEWRRRERAREAEVAALRAEYAALEGKARQVVAAAEERERRLVVAEEALGRRRRELEREQQGRAAEAEAAVRRLQVRGWHAVGQAAVVGWWWCMGRPCSHHACRTSMLPYSWPHRRAARVV